MTAHPVVQNRSSVEISFPRIARKRFESSLGAEHPRRPVRFGIKLAEQTEYRSAKLQGQQRTQLFLVDMTAITAVAAEVLVASISRECNRHRLSCELAHPVSRNRRAVGVRLVVHHR